MTHFPEKLYIIGSDSCAGKTLVSAILTLGLHGTYIKPIQCGVIPCTDTEWVKDITGLSKDHFLNEIYRFPDAHEPNTQHTDVNISKLLENQLQNAHGHLIIESTGGVMTPIYGDYFQVDYIADLHIPALLVVKNKKGAINQAILSIEKLKEKKIPLFGVVLNGPKDAQNLQSIKEYCKTPNVFELEHIEHITEKALLNAFESTFMKKVLTKIN